ncbi:MAG: uroporphyrinogen decarboxylase, partial [Planctomycetales bacterium]|nr:uroporphyrinogen decarboxylase [Planctomycetales bacterium]
MNQSSGNLQGRRVVAFESRRADDTTRLIERFGGQPFVSPSMREVPLHFSVDVANFANELITGQIDLAIFMTGVGVSHLLTMVDRRVDRQRFLDSLSDIKTLVRGPKPLAALRELGISPNYIVPEPNTWREILATLDQHGPLTNQTVAIQEYGKTNASLIAGLEARGARVLSVSVYQWDFPEDMEPLRENVRRVAAGEADVVVFTSAQQVNHVLQVADDLELRVALRSALRKTVVASVGPTTSERLRQCDVPVDFEPSHPKLGHLISELAGRCDDLLRAKAALQRTWSEMPANIMSPNAKWYDSPFMKACRGEPTDVTPIWLMRQAGRYMAEYRAVREKVSFLELCKNPQLCSEVMITAVNRLGVDAAIIFSDLLPILEPMGLDLEFAAGDGPVIHNPIRGAADVDRVRELESMDSLDFVVETVRQTRADLPEHLPLIGFAGAPFTLASYMIEGGSSRNYLHTKSLMYRDPGAWRELMHRIARAVVVYLNSQIAAGAQCVQLFDSWVGCLSPADYRQYVLPFVQQIIQQLVPGVPVINFATGNPALLPLLAEGGGQVIGIDWRIELDDAWHRVGTERSVQGNLEPCV